MNKSPGDVQKYHSDLYPLFSDPSVLFTSYGMYKEFYLRQSVL